MPNWCQNSVKLVAPDTQVFDKFVEHMETHCNYVPPASTSLIAEDKDEPAGFCGYFIPEPNYDLAEIDPAHPDLHKDTTYRMPGWWDFRVGNWGTKWEINCDLEMLDIDDEELSITMHFDSAWSPPTGVYEAAVDQGWKVDATYCEPGCDFIGYFNNEEYEVTFALGDRTSTDAPEWLIDDYSYEYDCIEEYQRECDVEELSREEFVKKWGEDYAQDWDNAKQA